MLVLLILIIILLVVNLSVGLYLLRTIRFASVQRPPIRDLTAPTQSTDSTGMV